MKDPIVEEIRRARRELAAKFNFDLHALCEDLRRTERESGKKVVTLEPKKPARAEG